MSEVELLKATAEDLQRRVKALERTVGRLQRLETAGGGPVSTANVSNPPTAAQVTAAFGAPADISEAMIKFVDDNGAATAVYLVVPINNAWWIFTGTKAV